jgi:D-glycero-beta-D-manno-heptose 1-phosphate adenylyltransferase
MLEVVREKIFAGYDDFSPVLKRWKKSGDKVVFTNGCFDILHRGHVEYLSASADLGDRLVVGLNSDTSVFRLKGSGRPLLDEESRAMLLAALFFVDAVVLFSEDTPALLIDRLLPDFLIKGADYKIHEIAGHEAVLANGGCVETITLVPGFSTSDVITKIQNLPR